MSETRPTACVILRADLADAAHARAVARMISRYAADPMANGAPLPESRQAALARGLGAHPGALAWLALPAASAEDAQAGAAIGVAVAFTGFSTFAAEKLLNVHDVFVEREARGRGVATRLLAAAEAHARAAGYCKMTLEVQESNAAARAVYARAGFGDYALAASEARTLFLEKKLGPRA